MAFEVYVVKNRFDIYKDHEQRTALTRYVTTDSQNFTLVSVSDEMAVVNAPGGLVCFLNQTVRAATIPKVAVVLSLIEQEGLHHYKSCNLWAKFYSGLEPVYIFKRLELVRDSWLETFNSDYPVIAYEEMRRYPELMVRRGFYWVAREFDDYARMAWCFFYGSTFGGKDYGPSPLHDAVKNGSEAEVGENLRFIHNYSAGPVHETAFALAVRLHKWKLADLIYAANPKIAFRCSFTKEKMLLPPIVDAMETNDEDAMSYFSVKRILDNMAPCVTPYISTLPMWFLENISQCWYLITEIAVENAYDAFRLRLCGIRVSWSTSQYEFLKRNDQTLQQRCAASILLNKICTDALPEALANWILK